MIDLFEEGGYGRFDPSTFGLWLRIDRAVEHPGFAEWGPLMWQSFQFPPQAEHAAYLDGTTEQDLPLLLSAFSLYAHESRHFFDLLATPYGAAVMRTYTHAALGYVSIVDEVRYQYRGIMVPLADWVAHGELLSDLYADLSKPSPGIAETVELWQRHAEMLEAYDRGRWGGDGYDVTARSILESSAVLHQERHLNAHFGLERAETLRASILSGPAAKLYYSPALVLREFIANAGGAPSSSVVSYLLLATLCGDWNSPNTGLPHYPAEIYLHLLDWIRRRGAAPLLSSLEGAWTAVDAFFEEERGQTLQQALAAARAANEQAAETFHLLVDDFEQRWEQESAEGRRLVAHFEDYSRVAATFADNVFGAPDWYFGHYDQDEMALPTPMLFIESEVGVPVDDFIRENYALVVSGNAPGEPTLALTTFEGPFDFGAVERGEKLVQGVRGDAAANVLSPLAPPGRMATGDAFPTLDLELWRAVHEDVGAIRFLLEGPEGGMSPHVVQAELGRLGVLGTAVYTRDRQLAVPLTSIDDLAPDAVETIESIRRRKLAQRPWSDLWWAEEEE